MIHAAHVSQSSGSQVGCVFASQLFTGDGTRERRAVSNLTSRAHCCWGNFATQWESCPPPPPPNPPEPRTKNPILWSEWQETCCTISVFAQQVDGKIRNVRVGVNLTSSASITVNTSFLWLVNPIHPIAPSAPPFAPPL